MSSDRMPRTWAWTLRRMRCRNTSWAMRRMCSLLTGADAGPSTGGSHTDALARNICARAGAALDELPHVLLEKTVVGAVFVQEPALAFDLLWILEQFGKLLVAAGA